MKKTPITPTTIRLIRSGLSGLTKVKQRQAEVCLNRMEFYVERGEQDGAEREMKRLDKLFA